jgi:hypothetical protein
VIGERRDGRRAVVQFGSLVGDERGAVLAVDVHRDLAGLEGVVGRELLAHAGAVGLQLVESDLVDEVFLPLDDLSPTRVRTDVARAVVLQPGRTDRHGPVGRRVLVVAHERVEPEHVDGAVGVVRGHRQGHLLQLFERLRGVVVARGGEHVVVDVQPVRVGQHRERATRALELRVAGGRVAELAQVDAVALDVGSQVAERAAAAERADDVGRVRDADVDVVAGRDRLLELLVVLARMDVDGDVRVRGHEVVDDGLDDLAFAVGEEVPERHGALEVRGCGRGDALIGRAGAGGEQSDGRDRGEGDRERPSCGAMVHCVSFRACFPRAMGWG